MTLSRTLASWTTWVPALALVTLALTWGAGDLPLVALVLVAGLLGACVLAAVHHAEVIAHKVGEPFGSLVLALAVTVIEVGLILMLMSAGGEGSHSLARDTVFAAVMITTNGIAGLALLVASLRHGLTYFNAEGAGAALATVIALATLTLVMPSVTTSAPGGQYSTSQLVFAAVFSLVLWGLYVFTQTVRHRDFFLPVTEDGESITEGEHADGPSTRDAVTSLGVLVAALVGVVGLAKVVSPAIEDGVQAAGLPHAVVGVVIALLVLAPETLAASRNAARGRAQVSLNLAYGSAIASIGLTVPAIVIATFVLDKPLVLGLEPVHMMLLALTGVVSVLTVVPGRATRLQGALHLCLLAAFVFLTAVP